MGAVERTISGNLYWQRRRGSSFRNSISRPQRIKQGSLCARRSAAVQGHAVANGEGAGSCFADNNDQLDGCSSGGWGLLHRQLVGHEDRFHFDWSRAGHDWGGFSTDASGEET